jgi:hypothetical protein
LGVSYRGQLGNRPRNDWPSQTARSRKTVRDEIAQGEADLLDGGVVVADIRRKLSRGTSTVFRFPTWRRSAVTTPT